MENPRIVGYVVSVNGFRVKVEILKETRSPSRATLDGVQTAIAINSYLIFSIGAGRSIIGSVTDLEARESYDPSSGDELSLELLKARRVVTVQLLGTVEYIGKNWQFNPGITVLPTLDMPAEIGSPEVMEAVFERPPQKNRPDNYNTDNFDHALVLGSPTGQKDSKVKASYNDLFSRPLAIVGNTGSGKSYTVASILQKAMSNEILGNSSKNAPHIFILDINGEYGRAFGIQNGQGSPNSVYLNGEKFDIPLWLFNAQEICAWLSASEQTQEPVLKDWWSIAKSRSTTSADATSAKSDMLRNAQIKIRQLVSYLDSESNIPVREKFINRFNDVKSYTIGEEFTDIDGFSDLEQAVEFYRKETQGIFDTPPNEKEIKVAANRVVTSINFKISNMIKKDISSTADIPLPISKADLINPNLIDRAVSKEDADKIESYLMTLKLRLKTRLDDKRWKSFVNYEDADLLKHNLESWLNKFGFDSEKSARVSIIDLSMLSHEVLPYACGVIGRILLEARERLPAQDRYKNPWTLVLEEAHNYARPRHQNEDKGQELSRSSFERIAKEGRKFGLSLIVASQRPSEISPTIISQCANFISHRLQNPDDIDHFRRIIPMQARRLLDQVTVLASGESIAFGSAFHIPTRVQIDEPDPPPWSQTAAPYYEWKNEDATFPLAKVIKNWLPSSDD